VNRQAVKTACYFFHEPITIAGEKVTKSPLTAVAITFFIKLKADYFQNL